MNNNAKKVTIFKKISIILLIFALSTVIASTVYINNYYHAVSTVSETLRSPARGITIKERNSALFFYPEENNDKETGFIFYPGGKVEYISYAPLMERLAEYGITCILPKMPGNLAILGIDRAVELKSEVPGIKEWYIGGHSLGGASAGIHINKFPAEYKGIVLLGAYSTKPLPESVSAILIYGSNDKVMNMESYLGNLENMPSNFEEHKIEGGCHAYFGSYGEQKGDGEPDISPEEQQMITAELIKEWMLEK